MRERFLIFLKLFIFWMFVMAVARTLFLLYNHDLSSALTFSEILLAMLHGMKMDLSMTGYAMALTGLLLTLSVFIRGRWIVYGIAITTFLFLLVSLLIVIIDMELYRHWGFRMNTTPLFYMGSEAIGSIDGWMAAKVISIGVALCIGLGWIYFRFIATSIRQLQPCEKKVVIALLPLTLAMFLLIRGSVSVAPMNTGFVYFHKTKMYANHAAINVVWNFFKSLSTSHVEYPEDFFDKNLTEQYFNELHPKSDSTYSILKTKKPNVILIIVESFTAGVIAPLGGLPNISPRINALCNEGILFDHFYCSGDRTDKGIVSVLSAYPTQPNSSIIKYPQKSQHLPFLNRSMMALGYSTSFTYGGDADFANFRSYLTASGFEHITETDDFSSELNSSKWGVHDGFMLKRALQEIDTAHRPYFKVILTQSSHEPFDVPMKPLLPPNTTENQFLNSCHYTDSCLGSFIDALKTQKEEWSNTLVLITADHGHREPHNKPYQSKARFHIPFLLLGGALLKDSVIHTLGNQTDIANTLLAQLAQAEDRFTFSTNLFGTPVNEHAIFFFTDGYGFILPNKLLVYDNTAKQFIKKENTTMHDEELSKAYQQKLYSDFNTR